MVIRDTPKLLEKLRSLDSLPLLLIRLYLAPVFLSAGFNKLNVFSETANWFGNADWGLGLPFPTLMASLAIFAEIVGGFALLFGLGTRLMSIPLMVTMLVAAFAVHWEHGWFAIAQSNPNTSMAAILDKVGFPGAAESLEHSAAVSQKLERANGILVENGNIDWLTEAGNFVVLNNGIEFAATYFIMLLVLFVYGPGKVSVDHLVYRSLTKK